MGVQARLVLFAPSEDLARTAAAGAFERVADLDATLSDYRPDSELMVLCRQAGGPPQSVSPDLWRVLVRAQEIARASGGAFDVTVGPLTRLWREARRAGRLPLTAALDDAREITGFSLLKLDPHRRTLWFQKSGMSLDLGGIGKGYAADAALAELAERGITRALVDLGGDLSLGDAPPGRAGWRVQVGGEGPLLLARRGVATSGDLEQFVEIEGVRYSHILDPRTGIGLTDRGRVTVISRHCIDADAFASALSVLDPDAGLELVEKQPFTAARIERVIDGRHQVFRSPELSAPGHGDPPVLR